MRTTSTPATSTAETAATDPPDRETHEAAGPNPRHAVTYDGGVLVLDALTGDPLAELPTEGFTRLNQAGDDRHLFVTEGEAFRLQETGTVGCENGIVVVTGDTVEHIAADQDYARIGNQAGSDASTIVLGDYKTEPDAELERPTQVSLADTPTGEIQVVDLPVSYSFRSLARGPEGEALVLGTDGTLRVIDPDSGEIVVEAVVTTYELPQVPNEVAVASGAVAKGAHDHDADTGAECRDH